MIDMNALTEEELEKMLAVKKKEKKKTEYSKKIFAGVSTATVIITLFSMYMIWKTGDTAVLSYLIPSIFTEFATATGFYYWKAKNENMMKIGGNTNG